MKYEIKSKQKSVIEVAENINIKLEFERDSNEIRLPQKETVVINFG